jgi:alkylation response protein AidB-like acyl-CoA dehydrogenase/predicted heme/steroid binding protein
MATSKRMITRKELEAHNQEGSGWVIINDDVYDLSKFYAMHPGGEEVLREFYGKDATEAFYGLHRHEALEKYAPKLVIGRIEGGANPPMRMETASDISEVPFAEAPFFRGEASPVWKPEHIEFRKEIRRWIQDNLREEAEACELSGDAPSDACFKKLADYGMLAMRIGPGEHLKWAPKGLPLGIKPEDFDYFHEQICHEEVGRLATPGFTDGIGSGMVIGLPPLINFGSDWMKNTVVPEILRGEKRICLAITEPTAGSDVANIRTTATLTPDGKYYIVNGVKKWITNGHDSHYFTTLVRTGGRGAGGLSFLLITRTEGVETKRITTSYSKSAGTAYIQFNNVKVPVENLIGAENSGFFLSMSNFVHERWMIISYIIAASRGILAEVYKWAHQRKAFGKSLLQQPVVRQRLAKMSVEVEAVTAAHEMLTYQMCQMTALEQGEKLAAKVSLLKYYSTRVAQDVSDDAVNIFGGRAITSGGMGRLIERFNRTYKFAAILGGSEDVLADAAIRMSVKDFPDQAKL